jgi:histidine triad (HIT) family protein
MALTPEQVKALKSQLLAQIQNLPEDKKTEAQAQIESLSPQALELMLKQQAKAEKEQSVFRLIVKGEIPSAIVDENKEAIAVLEINPISKAHIIIIPRKPVTSAKEMPTKAFSLAKKLSKRITLKLKAKSAEIQTETKFREMIINIIPIYDKELNINSPRYKASKEELEEIAQEIRIKKKAKIEKIKKEKPVDLKTQILKLPRKIP